MWDLQNEIGVGYFVDKDEKMGTLPGQSSASTLYPCPEPLM